jgi:lysophospholipase L1-like esterase
MPLTTRSPGWKRMLNRILGRREAADVANVNRERYNIGIRTRYPGDPLFDLAAVESTAPDGSRSTFALNGETGYALIEEYTTDGGHLNVRGRMAAARELVRVLATIP